MLSITEKLQFPRVKKRAILELAGLLILVLFSASQWKNIQESISTIAGSNLAILSSALVLYWLLLPITSLSYKLLMKRKVKTIPMTLAQLAGSGPGRIVPGGLGRLGVTALHLIKIGVSAQQAIIVSATNNIIGIFLNVLFLIALFFLSSSARTILGDSVSGYAVVVILATIILIGILINYLLKVRQINGKLLKFSKQWKQQIKLLASQPYRFVGLLLVATVILNVNIAILLLSAHSIGISISYVDALIALSSGVLVGGILPTPGGLGGVEAGTAGMLFLLGYGAPEATSVAILFRAITYWQPLIPGTIAYFHLKKHKQL